MIILPKRLNDMLSEVDEARRATLALDFAERAIGIQAEGIHPKLLGACREYIGAAREALELGRAHGRLVEAHEQLVQVSWDFAEKSLSTNIVSLAVALGCQRMMEEVGALHRASRRARLDCQFVAQQAQLDIAAWYSRHAPDGADSRQVHQAARWEEARWQLLHVISTEPNPSVDQAS
ncbi:hypothetical protein AB0I66_33345 [Streptomyces sp. NPDC050439]|uniref:hypothetical protein n=1 Tax=unclassified Streptomyces TaxID=2593676 RepID=UPI00344AF7FE